VTDARTAGVAGVLRRLWRGWTRVGRALGDLQARILLTVFYFLVVAPFALVVRLTADPLALRPGTPRGWRVRAPAEPLTLERARQQS